MIQKLAPLTLHDDRLTATQREFAESLEEPEETICEACYGPGEFIGQLGDLTHYRCRNCGIHFAA